MKHSVLFLATFMLLSMPGCLAKETQNKTNVPTKKKGPTPKPVNSNKPSTKEVKELKAMQNLKTGDKLNLSTFEKTKDGILYKIITPAPEDAQKVKLGEKATVHYTGWLLNGNISGNMQDQNTAGQKFDSSRDRGQHFEFVVGLGMVIKGWDLTLADMKVGERRVIVLPHHLGYGSRGAGSVIPPHATLIFDIEAFAAQ